MKKLLFIAFILHVLPITTEEVSNNSSTPSVHTPGSKAIKSIAEPEKQIKQKELYVAFEYKDTPLATIISDLASKKGINLIIPLQGPDALITQVNYKIEHKIHIEEAWNIIITLLNLAGYSLVPHKDLSYIIKNDPANSTRESFPLYINTPLETLRCREKKLVVV